MTEKKRVVLVVRKRVHVQVHVWVHARVRGRVLGRLRVDCVRRLLDRLESEEIARQGRVDVGGQGCLSKGYCAIFALFFDALRFVGLRLCIHNYCVALCNGEH